MKISVDDKELFTLSEIQKKVILNDIREEEFKSDMQRRLRYALMNKYEKCFERLKEEWEPILIQDGLKYIPTNKEEFAELVFKHSKYKNRSQRELDLL